MSQRILFCGDPHVTPTEIADCQVLLDLVLETAVKYHVNRVVFLGDQHHNFAVIHVEVQGFWLRNLAALNRAGLTSGDASGPSIIMLLGNHDKPGTESPYHALMAYETLAMVVTQPFDLGDGILYCPNYDNGRLLEEAVAKHPRAPHTLVCHETFDGSCYENGFYAKDGANPEAFSGQELILSGHIHTPQVLGKVRYLGAPRWRTESDANVERHLWVMDFDDSGHLLREVGISTGSVCRRIVRLEDSLEKPLPPLPTLELDTVKDDVRVDITGTSAYCLARAEALRQQLPQLKIRTARVDTAHVPVRESEGVDTALAKYVDAYRPRHGTDKARLRDMVRERLGGGTASV